MDATTGLKKAVEQLREDTDKMINRLRNDIKESKAARQKRRDELHRIE